MNNFDDFLQAVRDQFGSGVSPEAFGRAPEAARTESSGAAGAHSLESSSLEGRWVPDGGMLAPEHTRQSGLLNVTMVRYPDGWSACVWRSSDPPAPRKDFEEPAEKKTKGESERWGSSIIRAKARVRHLARCLGIGYLWTFTKRGKFESLDRLWAAWKEFCRLMRKRHGARWRYIAVPELHSDGVTWHLHVGMSGFWDVNQLRVYWHRALGANGLVRGANSPGNVDAKRFRGRTARAIASYIAKYIGKGMSSVLVGKKLYVVTEGVRPLERINMHFVIDVSGDEMQQWVNRELQRLSGTTDWWESKACWRTSPDGQEILACWMFET